MIRVFYTYEKILKFKKTNFYSFKLYIIFIISLQRFIKEMNQRTLDKYGIFPHLLEEEFNFPLCIKFSV